MIFILKTPRDSKQFKTLDGVELVHLISNDRLVETIYWLIWPSL